MSLEASLDMLNSGWVFLKYLNTAADFADHKVILGFFSTVSMISDIFFSSSFDKKLSS